VQWGFAVKIRTFQSGDEPGQLAIYNEAAARFPNFKSATLPEILRRTRARDFDPSTRLYAEEGVQLIGYCVFNPSGRLSYPWCLPGHEHCAEPLFSAILQTMRQRGLTTAFAAYREDWPAAREFFEQHGFHKAREMVNFVQDLNDMPTVPARPSSPFTDVQRSDVPALLTLAPGVLRVKTAAELEKHLFDNPYFSARDLFALRNRSGTILAVGLLITDPSYADPRAIDPLMPCFRLGAFGTEGLDTKRIKGLFSFLARDDKHLPALVLDVLSQASLRLQETDDIYALAAQVASDVPFLMHFYQRNFQRQGAFPVFERSLTTP
jgi:hypothetical protein